MLDISDIASTKSTADPSALMFACKIQIEPECPASSTLTAREIWLWVTCGFIALRLTRDIDGVTGLAVLPKLAEHNILYLFVYAVLIAKCRELPGLRASKATLVRAVLAFIVMALFAFSDIGSFDGLVALVLAILIAPDLKAQPRMVPVALLYLTLAIHLFLAKLAFILLKTPIIIADAVLTELALRLTGHEVYRSANGISATTDHSIAIIGACSSFNNVSLAVLVAVSAIILAKDRLSRCDLWGVAAVSILMVVANTIRLAIFAIDFESYLYWHHGPGAPFLAFGQTLIVAAAAMWIGLRARRVSAA